MKGEFIQMKINICSPVLTIGDNEEIGQFYKELVRYIKEYTSVNEIENMNRVNELKDTIDSDTLIILFNKEKEYDEKIIHLLKKANEKEAVIWPVAMHKDVRMPVEIVKQEQSFDIKVRQENRKTDNMAVLAQIFAREVMSRALPTFYAEGKKILFVSHRRTDGEDIAAKLCDRINMLGRTRDRKAGREAFRDAVEVKVGEAAQDVIDSALTISDVLIFLHTPDSVNSEWIQKEVIYALLNGIPIVWIRIDNASLDKLRVLPSEKPHLECVSTDFEREDFIEDYVNKIEDLCFKLVMNNRNNVWEQKDRFESWASTHNVEILEENKTYQIYKAVYKEKCKNKYERRPLIQYLQYYGRTIKEEDIEFFDGYLKEKGENDKTFDTAVMLSCNEHINMVKNYIYKNGFNEHLNYWKNEVAMVRTPRKKEKIVISGAFPDCEEYNKYVLTEALSIFAHEIISHGYTLVFGSHPTFRKLIFTIAKEECAEPRQAVKMFISKAFEYNIDEIADCATVCETENLNDKAKSLTLMREQMLEEKDIAAVICIGGKMKEGTLERNGVDEEMEIARKNNLPVFLVGSVGGLTEKRAAEFHKKGSWEILNDAGKELNEMFRSNLEYRKIFRELMKYLEKNSKSEQ